MISAVVGVVVTMGGDEVIEGRSLPVAIRLHDDPAQIPAFSDTSMRMLVPARPQAAVPVPRRDMCSGGFRSWALRLGGSDSEETRVRLDLQGRSTKGVLISSLTARIVAVHPSPAVVGVGCDSAGSASPRDLSIDLDSARPTARYLVKGRREPFGFTLAKAETEVFNITAYTRRPVVIEWRLHLDLTVDGKSRPIEIDDHGKPFRTSAAPAERQYTWQYDGWHDHEKPVADPFG
ncbi:hypothetical protein [Thermomonospora umbrina]|uniref:hypothetical protein n=1 Tax=Thermomonospora umbrina TaxID=111806 RepID=UPI0011C1378C|nr:hypothetical protein [Thermomonospora umbrina]